MASLIAVENVSLDGVMQAPGGAEEDTRGGFDRGGWFVPYSDEVIGRYMGERMHGDGAILLGRRTWEQFAGFWPKQADNPYTRTLNATTKYVATRGGIDTGRWSNSVALTGDCVAAVAELKRTTAGTITVIGSGDLLQTLIDAELIDEYLLLIAPLVLGAGRPLFEPGRRVALTLVESTTSSTGVLIARYRQVSE